MFRYFSKTSFSPNGINWGHYADPRVDGLLMQAQESFDSERKIELLAQAHAIASAGRKSATISRKPERRGRHH